MENACSLIIERAKIMCFNDVDTSARTVMYRPYAKFAYLVPF